MSLRIPPLAIGVAVLLATALPLRAAAGQQVKWEGLSMVIGKTVSLVTSDAVIVTGTALEVRPDALVLKIRKTTDARLWPKGSASIARATLRTLQLQKKGVKFRVIGTAFGVIAGAAGGLAAGIGVNGGIFNDDHPTAAPLTAAGILAGGTLSGYFLGNAADRKSVVIEIVP